MPFVIACLAIFIESSFPSESYPSVEFELSDKIIHFIIYFVLFLTTFYSFSNQKKFIVLCEYSLFSSFIFTLLYGASDEFHQYFIPGRTCDIFDWIADVTGAVVAISIILLLKKLSKKNKLVNNVL
jgi:VanZ family protein